MNKTEASMSDIVTKALEDNLKGLGKINILIVGKTGVGKSTLINTVFRDNLAEVGHGKPVTQRIEEISKDGTPLTIFDTKGLELEDYDQILQELVNLIEEKNSSTDFNEHIHIAWLCLSASGHRLEDAEENLLEMLSHKNVPAIVVMTKYMRTEGNKDFVEFVSGKVKDKAKFVVPVNSVPEKIEGTDISLPVFGVDELIEKTELIVPEAKQAAYASALSTKNKKALEIKKKQANKEVNIAAGLAASAAAIPIPFSDAATLVPIQVGMIAKIGSTFGMELSANTLSTLVTSAVGASAATVVGRTIVTGLLKMIPAAGSVVGGAIAATTASAITKTLGNAYVSIMYDFVSNNPGKEIDVALLGKELKKRMSLS